MATVDLSEYRTYASARRAFLTAIGLPISCRDPLSEFSEWLAAAELGATKANSRVQKGFDLVRQSGRRIQVKYLANPSDRWVNEHSIAFPKEADDYALVIFEAMQVVSMVVFPRETLAAVCESLGKRHGNTETTLQFTRRNWQMILANTSKFASLGVEAFRY